MDIDSATGESFPVFETYPTVELHFKKGLASNIWRWYHEKGQIDMEISYKDGKYNGASQGWNEPTKMSNHKKLIKQFLKIADNPYKYWESLQYNDKRTFQNILFPEGFRLSLKNKECRTPKLNLMLELTNCFSDAYSSKKQKTQKLLAFESRLVAGTGLEPVTFGL